MRAYASALSFARLMASGDATRTATPPKRSRASASPRRSNDDWGRTAPSTRMTAAERRETVLDAATKEFAAKGLHGASTDDIARAAGISQPYLFRLFRTKKELYLATVERSVAELYEVFAEAGRGRT